MAAPTFTLINHQALTTADANTGWSDLVTPDPDIKVEGTNAMSGILRADGEQGYYDAGSAPATAVGKTVRGWIFTNNLAYMDTEAVDPYKLLAYDGTTEEQKTIFGSDTYPGGWFNYVWDMDDFTTLTLANVQRWGVECGHSVNSKNVINTWMDVIRYLDGYSMVGGASGTEVQLSDIAILDKVSAYNVVSVAPRAANVFFGTGNIQFGTGATTHYFLSDGDILTFVDLNVAEGLYSLSGVGSGTNITIKNGLYQAAGAADTSRFIFDMSDTDLALFLMTGHTLVRAAAVTFKSGQTVTGNVFTDCQQITAAGADMKNSVISGYEGTADTSAMIWNVATDPNGLLDGADFTMGTALTHALELGLLSPLSMTLKDMVFTGYGADASTSAALHIKRTSGTVTINYTGTVPTYKSDGATVVLVSSKTATFTPIENGSAFTITKDSDNSVLEDVASTTGGEVVYSYDGALDGTAATVHLIIAGKEPIDFPWTVAEGTVPVSQVTDRIYSNP